MLKRNDSPSTMISVPLLLLLALFFMPAQSANRKILNNIIIEGQGSKQYAVIFDAGSSGSRVHVFCFDQHLDLIPIGNVLEIFVATKPGLSSYADDPKAAALSLQPLLQKAESAIPADLQPNTPVKVGATAGLRLLKGDAAERILQAVRDFLKENSTLQSKDSWVTVLQGSQEGAYLWVTVNYLLENLDKKYADTVGVADLGGGSVQMAYAISDTDASNAPKVPDSEDPYVKKMYLRGTKYNLYTHSYLKYGGLAARAEILKIAEDSGSPCILTGYHGSYEYGGITYGASSPPSGSSMKKCRNAIFKILKVNDPCTHKNCTFGGVWNGGGGAGQKNLFLASFFYGLAAEVGFIDPNVPIAKARPVDYQYAAKRACKTGIENAKSTYPRIEEDDLPYVCMDLVYQFTLLVDGFGLDPYQEITLVNKVTYKGFEVEAAWPLGSAIEVVSSSSSSPLLLI